MFSIFNKYVNFRLKAVLRKNKWGKRFRPLLIRTLFCPYSFQIYSRVVNTICSCITNLYIRLIKCMLSENARTGICICHFKQMLPIQCICPMHNEVALHFPQWRYLVNLRSCILITPSWNDLSSELVLKSRIQETNWFNFIFSRFAKS